MSKNRVLLTVLILLSFVISQTQAQDSTKPIIVGLLIYDTPSFIDEMTQLGYVEGQDVTYMTLVLDFTLSPELLWEQITIQTQAMLDAPVDVLVVNNDTDAVNYRAMTADIPIVFTIADDPVTTGAVADLTTPGGNTTGIVSNQHHPRRLQLLTEITPTTDKVYYLYYALAIEGAKILEQVTTLGDELGVEVIPAPVSDLQTGLDALVDVPEGVDWLFMTPFLPFDLEFADALAEVSTSRNIAIAGFFGSPTPDYLINYGPDLTVAVRQSAQIVDRILRIAVQPRSNQGRN